MTLLTVNQRIAERIFVSGILPGQPIQDDRRIEAFDVVALVNHPAPPSLAHIVGEFDTQRPVVPRAAKAAVDFRRWINEAATLRQRNDGLDVWSRHRLVNRKL